MVKFVHLNEYAKHNTMEKHTIPDRRAVYEKPEVESIDLSMEQPILVASPDFNPFNPEETW